MTNLAESKDYYCSILRMCPWTLNPSILNREGVGVYPGRWALTE